MGLNFFVHRSLYIITIYTSQYFFKLVYIRIYQYLLPAYTRIYQDIPVYMCVPIYYSIYQYLPVYTSICQYVQESTIIKHLVSINYQFKPEYNCIYYTIPHIPVYTCKYQPKPKKCSLFSKM